MKSSIPVLVDRPARHAAAMPAPRPLQIHSVGVSGKLEGVGGFSRTRRTIHPHVGVATRRRQHELTSSATHEMHLPPREVSMQLSVIILCVSMIFVSFSHREAQVLDTSSRASMPHCHKYPVNQESPSLEHQPLPLLLCHTSPPSLCPLGKSTHCPLPQADW